MSKLFVLSDEHCTTCEGHGALQGGAGPRCDKCRGTGGTWVPLAEALAQAEEDRKRAMRRNAG